MTIQTKQVEVFVVGDKEFTNIEEAQAYEKFLQTEFTSEGELEKSVEEKMIEENFEQYKHLTLSELYDKAFEFGKEFFSNYTYKGDKIINRVHHIVFHKYILSSIRENFTEFEHLSDETVMDLYNNAFYNGHSGGIYEVTDKLYDIAVIVEILQKDESN